MKTRFRLSIPACCGVVLAATLAALAAPSAHAGRVHGVRANGDGSATAATGVARRGPNGGTARRAGTTSVHADGSASHSSGLSASNARGTVDSSGSASRDAAGNAQQSRTTTATSAATGNSVQASTTTTREAGVVDRDRSVTCTDAAGAVIACR